MPAALSNDLKERIVKWYNVDGLTMKDISSTAECSIGLVSNVLRNYRQYGQVNVHTAVELVVHRICLRMT
jgi:transposase